MKSLRFIIAAAAIAAFASTAVFAGPAASPLVDAQWLQQHRDNPDLKILDVRSSIDGTDAAGFAAGHIPGAVYASYTQSGWRVAEGSVPDKLPEVAEVEALIRSLGIDSDDTVVIAPAGVSSTDFGSAARVYWTFKYLGHDEVAILDGGYKAWVDAGGEVATGEVSVSPGDFSANPRPELLAETPQVAAASESGGELVDARPAKQFSGAAKHPASLASGTIPGAKSLEERLLVEANSSRFIDASDVSRLIETAGIDTDEPVIAFCNTGHWAATAWFALSEVAGIDNVSLYDGSMTEWTQDTSREVVQDQTPLSELLN